MNSKTSLLNAAVIVAALGYFVDAFDMLLFGVIRVKSLLDLGFSDKALTDAGIYLQNMQMVGLFIGGVGAGIMGDKIGRVKVLYFSIALYSVGTALNGMVQTLDQYAWCRFFAGIGLAGELGTGFTLVSESLPREKRGLGATLVAAFGLSGAAAAGAMNWLASDWRTAFFIGGGLGVLLLILRLSVSESDIFLRLKSRTDVPRGRVLDFFTHRERFVRLLKSTLLGVTTWFVVGILMILAPEFGKAKGIPEPIVPALAVIWFHVGMVLGDIGCGLWSQYLKSRLKALRTFLGLQLFCVALYLFAPVSSASAFYGWLTVLGFSAGFWAVFITNATEQFGSNLRATAAGLVPSFVRLFLVPISLGFQFLKNVFEGVVPAAAVIGVITLGLAFWASYGLKESFDTDLDFVE